MSTCQRSSTCHQWPDPNEPKAVAGTSNWKDFNCALRLQTGSWAFWGGFRLWGLGFGTSLQGSRSLRVDPGYPDPKNRLQPHVPARAKARRVVQKSCFQSKHVRLMSDWQFKNGRVGKEDPLRASENHITGDTGLKNQLFRVLQYGPLQRKKLQLTCRSGQRVLPSCQTK